mmetsp:Transcript_98165/g.194400  ORF Transcript_98165/g.194400 Transcript_98165/m.194400 type:complete len:718 (+) Transcript_98165:44-2197(+)
MAEEQGGQREASEAQMQASEEAGDGAPRPPNGKVIAEEQPVEAEGPPMVEEPGEDGHELEQEVAKAAEGNAHAAPSTAAKAAEEAKEPPASGDQQQEPSAFGGAGKGCGRGRGRGRPGRPPGRGRGGRPPGPSRGGRPPGKSNDHGGRPPGTSNDHGGSVSSQMVIEGQKGLSPSSRPKDGDPKRAKVGEDTPEMRKKPGPKKGSPGRPPGPRKDNQGRSPGPKKDSVGVSPDPNQRLEGRSPGPSKDSEGRSPGPSKGNEGVSPDPNQRLEGRPPGRGRGGRPPGRGRGRGIYEPGPDVVWQPGGSRGRGGRGRRGRGRFGRGGRRKTMARKRALGGNIGIRNLLPNGKCRITIQSKQSGFEGVCWDRGKSGWLVRWREPPYPRHKYFCVPHYLRDKKAKTLEEAEAMALRDAVQFRFDLVKAGKIRKWAQGDIQSGVVGVKWRPEKNAWQVRLMINGQTINGGLCIAKNESPEAIEKARTIAVEKRRELERKYFDVHITVNDPALLQEKADMAAGLAYTWENGMFGVTWEGTVGAWRARAKEGFNASMGKKEVNRRFFPTDRTPEAIERARQAAIVWLQAQRNAPSAVNSTQGKKRARPDSIAPKEEPLEANSEFQEPKEEIKEAEQGEIKATMAAAVGSGSAAEADAAAAAAEASSALEADAAETDGVPEASMAVDAAAGDLPEAMAVDTTAGGAIEAATTAVPPLEEPMTAAS